MPEQIAEDLVALRARIAAFVEAELLPLEGTLPAEAEFGDIDADLRAEVRARARAAGVFGLTQPAAFRPGGAPPLPDGPLARTVAREEVARHNLRVGAYVFGPEPGVLGGATGEARDRFLDPLMRGEAAAGFAFTEPTGPDAGEPTYAEWDGDDLVVTGRKSYVTNGPFCDFYTVLAGVRPPAGGADATHPAGMTMIAVERGAPGLTIPREFSTMDGARHCEIALAAVRVPRAHVIGEVGGGMQRALGHIGEERLAVAAQAAGTAMWATEFIHHHITQPHRQGGTLGDREGVRRVFAEMRIETYGIRAAVYRTARLAASGGEILNEASAAKVIASEGCGRVVDQALQLAGGDALRRGHPLERTYRQVRSLRVGGGATDILRLAVARGALEFHAGRL